MKCLIATIALFVLTSVTSAQVSCSPNVDKKMCADVATFLNPIVDHGTPYHGVGIPLEIVTPAEYTKRLADTKDLEKREAGFAGGMEVAAKSPDKFSPWYRHTLANSWSEDITFFRSRPSSSSVSAILISSVVFEGVTFGPADPKTNVVKAIPTGKYDPSRIGQTAGFIGGYLCGTMATVWDGSATMDNLVKPN